MFGIDDAIAIPAALSAGEFVASTAFNYFQNNSNRKFQENMANTAHQREVADLQKAGLNPILSVRNGGAQTPSTQPATAANSNLAQTYNQSKSNQQQTQLIQAQIADINSAKNLKDAQTNDVNATQADRIGLLIAQKRQALQTADLNDYTKLKVEQDIKNLESARQGIILQNTHSAYDLDASRNASDFEKLLRGQGKPDITGSNLIKLLKSLKGK